MDSPLSESGNALFNSSVEGSSTEGMSFTPMLNSSLLVNGRSASCQMEERNSEKKSGDNCLKQGEATDVETKERRETASDSPSDSVIRTTLSDKTLVNISEINQSNISVTLADVLSHLGEETLRIVNFRSGLSESDGSPVRDEYAGTPGRKSYTPVFEDDRTSVSSLDATGVSVVDLLDTAYLKCSDEDVSSCEAKTSGPFETPDGVETSVIREETFVPSDEFTCCVIQSSPELDENRHFLTCRDDFSVPFVSNEGLPQKSIVDGANSFLINSWAMSSDELDKSFSAVDESIASLQSPKTSNEKASNPPIQNTCISSIEKYEVLEYLNHFKNQLKMLEKVLDNQSTENDVTYLRNENESMKTSIQMIMNQYGHAPNKWLPSKISSKPDYVHKKLEELNETFIQPDWVKKDIMSTDKFELFLHLNYDVELNSEMTTSMDFNYSVDLVEKNISIHDHTQSNFKICKMLSDDGSFYYWDDYEIGQLTSKECISSTESHGNEDCKLFQNNGEISLLNSTFETDIIDKSHDGLMRFQEKKFIQVEEENGNDKIKNRYGNEVINDGACDLNSVVAVSGTTNESLEQNMLNLNDQPCKKMLSSHEKLQFNIYKELELHKIKLVELNGQIDKLSSDNEVYIKKNFSLEQDLETAVSEISRLKTLNAESEYEVLKNAHLLSELDSIKQNYSDLRIINLELSNKISKFSNIEEQLKEVQSLNNVSKYNILEFRKSLSELSEKMKKLSLYQNILSNIKDHLNKLKNEYNALTKQLKEKSEECDSLRLLIKEHKRDEYDMGTDMKNISTSLFDVREHQNNIFCQIDELKNKNKKLNEEVIQLKRFIKEYNSNIADYSDVCTKTKECVTTVKQDCDLLKSQNENILVNISSIDSDVTKKYEYLSALFTSLQEKYVQLADNKVSSKKPNGTDLLDSGIEFLKCITATNEEERAHTVEDSKMLNHTGELGFKLMKLTSEQGDSLGLKKIKEHSPCKNCNYHNSLLHLFKKKFSALFQQVPSFVQVLLFIENKLSELNSVVEELEREKEKCNYLLKENGLLKEKIKTLDEDTFSKVTRTSGDSGCIKENSMFNVESDIYKTSMEQLQELRRRIVDQDSEITELRLNVERCNEAYFKKCQSFEECKLKAQNLKKRLSTLEKQYTDSLNKQFLQINRAVQTGQENISSIPNKLLESPRCSEKWKSFPITTVGGTLQLSGQPSGILMAHKIKEQENVIHQLQKKTLKLERLCCIYGVPINELKGQSEADVQKKTFQRNPLGELMHFHNRESPINK